MRNKVIELLKQEKTINETSKELGISYYKLRKDHLIPMNINGYSRFGSFASTGNFKRNNMRKFYNITRNSTCFKQIDSKIKEITHAYCH